MALYRAIFPGTFAAGDQFQFSLLTSGDETLSDAAAAASDWLAAFATNIESAYGPGTLFAAPEVRHVASSPGFPTIETAFGTGGFAGTNSSGNALPNQLAVVCTLRTASAGRAFRGRFYLPAPSPTTLTSSGTMNNLAHAQFQTALEAAFAAGSLFGTYVVGHKASGTSTLVTGADVGNVLDTQRRRRNKVVESRLTIIV